jgi:antitoxin (DNA-binding transcriptional repressor) of toxin-antitoxin stability system
MREVQASEAKAHLPQLLDDRAIARLVPEAHQRQAEIDQAIEAINRLRARAGKLTLVEPLSARHEGHKH